MGYRRILAAVAAALMLVSAYSCGKDDEKSQKEESSTSVTEESSEKSEKATTTAEETEESTTTAEEKSSSKKKTTTAKSKTTTTEADKKSTATTAVTTTGKSSKSGSSSSGGSSSGGGAYSEAGAENVQQPVQAETDSEYTAEIVLGATPSIKGANATADGTRVIISAGGDYMISGNTDDGQIFVDTATEEKVKIILNGVGISNTNGPAIMINEAKKCTVELMDGTASVLRDGAKDKINDGVIFSNDTLRIKGGGELYIYSNNAHGIASDDDVIIEGGTYEINSIKSGIFAHDDVTINDGKLLIRGGTNGIKSKGSININGGHTTAYGGTKDEKSSVYSEGAFNYTGGYLYAAGNRVSVPSMSYNPYIVVDYGNTYDAGSTAELFLNDSELAILQPHNNFRSIMILAPEISAGSSFYTVINGNGSETFSVNDGQNLFNVGQ